MKFYNTPKAYFECSEALRYTGCILNDWSVVMIYFKCKNKWHWLWKYQFKNVSLSLTKGPREIRGFLQNFLDVCCVSTLVSKCIYKGEISQKCNKFVFIMILKRQTVSAIPSSSIFEPVTTVHFLLKVVTQFSVCNKLYQIILNTTIP